MLLAKFSFLPPFFCFVHWFSQGCIIMYSIFVVLVFAKKCFSCLFVLFIIAAKRWLLLLGISWFFTIQRIWIVLGRFLFFERSVHTFSWFLKSNWSDDFDHAETGSGAKKRMVLRREFFLRMVLQREFLKLSEKRVIEQKFAFSLVVFCLHAAISL